MVYIRFQSPDPGKRGVHTGVFGLANTLAREERLTEPQRAQWRAGNDWFNAAYDDPSTRDPTVYDDVANPRATAWFKDSAVHLLERVTPYLALLREHDVACERVVADDPGRVIYEDDVQVVVVPHDPAATTSYHPGTPDIRRRPGGRPG